MDFVRAWSLSVVFQIQQPNVFVYEGKLIASCAYCKAVENGESGLSPRRTLSVEIT